MPSLPRGGGGRPGRPTAGNLFIRFSGTAETNDTRRDRRGKCFGGELLSDSFSVVKRGKMEFLEGTYLWSASSEDDDDDDDAFFILVSLARRRWPDGAAKRPGRSFSTRPAEASASLSSLEAEA